MVHIDITPKSGKALLLGTYTWEYENYSEQFHIELSWMTSNGEGLQVNQILWQRDIDELKKSIAEIEIMDAYNKLNKEIVILLKDK